MDYDNVVKQYGNQELDDFLKTLPAFEKRLFSPNELQNVIEKFLHQQELFNPIGEQDVSHVDICMLLDVSDVLPIFLEQYSDNPPHNCLNPEAWIRLAYFRELENYRYLRELDKKLMTEPIIWMKLGFESRPKYQTICLALNKRMSDACKASLKRQARCGMIEAGEKVNIRFGQSVTQDSTPISVSDRDTDGSFNPHYKSRMLKANILTDTNHKLELEVQVFGGTEYDGHHSFEMISMVEDSVPEDAMLWGDNHYSSAPAWAIFGTKTKYELRFSISDSYALTINDAEYALKHEYQRHHTEANFQVTLDYDEMARYLADCYGWEYLRGIEQINSAYRLERLEKRLRQKISNKKRLLKKAFKEENYAKVKQLEELIAELETRCSKIKASEEVNRKSGEEKKTQSEKPLKIVGEYYKSKTKEERVSTPSPNMRVLSESKNSELKRKGGVSGILSKGIYKTQARFDVKLSLKFLIVRQRILYGYTDRLGNMFRIA